MNKMLIPIIAIVLIAGFAGFLVLNQQPQPNETAQMMEKKDTAMMEQPTDAMMAKAGAYTPYSTDAYESMADKKRVLFFHASWCPTCKASDADFTKNSATIPADIVVFKTDYDTEADLKKKYGITYQHTFVQVDAEGNEVSKWNGGAIPELLANIK